MKFIRQLAAVTLVVAAVVVLGLVWSHFGASTLAQNAPGRFSKEIVDSQHPGTVVMRGPGGRPSKVTIQIHGQSGMSLGLGSMFQAVNRPVVEHTIRIEVAVIAAVVIFDVGRRRARKARRAALLGQYRPPRQAAPGQPESGQAESGRAAPGQPESGRVAASQPAVRAASRAQQGPGQAP
jgi:hypothetical protein